MRLSDAVAALTIAGESASEPYECKVGVGNTIRNRQTDHWRFLSDGTVINTVLAPNQYDCWWNKKTRAWMDLLDMDDQLAVDCLKAWQESGTRDAVNGANFYYAETIPPPSWATPDKFTVKLGITRFCKR